MNQPNLFLSWLFAFYKVFPSGLYRKEVTFSGTHSQPSAVKDIMVANIR